MTGVLPHIFLHACMSEQGMNTCGVYFFPAPWMEDVPFCQFQIMERIARVGPWWAP